MTRPAFLDWYLNADGIQVYADWQGEGQGWLTSTKQCPECAHVWQTVAAVKSLGIECPNCGRCDVQYVWDIPEDALDDRTK